MKQGVKLGVAVVALAAGALWLWWWARPAAEPSAGSRSVETTSAGPTATSPIAGQASPFGNGAAATQAEEPAKLATTAPAGPPRHLTPAQVEMLQQVFEGHPQRIAKLARLLPALDHAVGLRRLTDAFVEGREPQEVAALAREVDAGIETRLQRGEMSLDDALAARNVVLEMIDPDEVARDARLTEWRQRVERSVLPDPQRIAARRAELGLLAEWALDPASATSAAELKRQLDRTRSTEP